MSFTRTGIMFGYRAGFLRTTSSHRDKFLKVSASAYRLTLRREKIFRSVLKLTSFTARRSCQRVRTRMRMSGSGANRPFAGMSVLGSKASFAGRTPGLLSLTQGRHAAFNHRANPNSTPFTIATRVVRSACASRVGRTTAANCLDGKVQTIWHPRSLRIRLQEGPLA